MTRSRLEKHSFWFDYFSAATPSPLSPGHHRAQKEPTVCWVCDAGKAPDEENVLQRTTHSTCKGCNGFICHDCGSCSCYWGWPPRLRKHLHKKEHDSLGTLVKEKLSGKTPKSRALVRGLVEAARTKEDVNDSLVGWIVQLMLTREADLRTKILRGEP